LERGSAYRKASTYTVEHSTEKYVHTTMPRAGFEPTFSVFEQSKIIPALDCVTIEINGCRDFCTLNTLTELQG